VEGECGEGAEDEEEDILEYYRLLSEAEEIVVGCGRGGGGVLLDAGPGKVDVEEEEENTEADYRGIELIMLSHQSIVQ